MHKFEFSWISKKEAGRQLYPTSFTLL